MEGRAMPFKRVQRPIIIGVVGDSASGKTTLTNGIATILGGEDKVLILRTDDYYRFGRTERMQRGITALDYSSSYLDILVQHLTLLREGQAILKPVYNHTTGTLGRPEYVEPHEFIIVEGKLGYASRELRDVYDVKVFLEPDEDLRVKWKLRRDTAERGYTEDEVHAQLKRRADDRLDFVVPQRTFADMVVGFKPPSDNSDETGAHLDVRHILRPTLPHPDLSPILEAGAKGGLRLELSRDIDGKPVDVMEIHGDIDDRRARAMEDLLWNLIPEAAHLRENVGAFMDDHNNRAMSHPLALSQLLVTFHIVKAALGHHAL